jgi:hypothetical protein
MMSKQEIAYRPLPWRKGYRAFGKLTQADNPYDKKTKALANWQWSQGLQDAEYDASEKGRPS